MGAYGIDSLTVAMFALLGLVVLLRLLIIGVRVGRTRRVRRRAALAAGPRRQILGFVADGGADGAEELLAIPPPAWRAVQPAAVALLGKIRGEGHAALVSVFEARGLADAALADLHGRSRVRRARAAEVLGNLGRRDAVPGLCALLVDPHPEVRVVAVRALGRIGDPAGVDPLLAALAASVAAPSQLVAHALIQIGPDATPALIAALGHPMALVRVTALDALGLLGVAGAAPAVAEVLQADLESDVRLAAAGTLGRLGTPSSLAPLISALAPDRPTPVRAAAARALGELGAKAAVPALVGVLCDPRYQVAHEAAHALRRLGPPGLAELRRVAGAVRRTDPHGGAATDRAVAHAREALALAAIADGGTDAPVGAPPLASVG